MEGSLPVCSGRQVRVISPRKTPANTKTLRVCQAPHAWLLRPQVPAGVVCSPRAPAIQPGRDLAAPRQRGRPRVADTGLGGHTAPGGGHRTGGCPHWQDTSDADILPECSVVFGATVPGGPGGGDWVTISSSQIAHAFKGFKKGEKILLMGQLLEKD